MEATQYADLKAARDEARKEYSLLSAAERSLKRSTEYLTHAGQTEPAEAVALLRANGIRPQRIAAQEKRDSLEAQVNEARAEYRAEKVAKYEEQYS